MSDERMRAVSELIEQKRLLRAENARLRGEGR